MADLAKLVVKLEAQTAKFQKDLAKSETKVKKFGKSTKSSLKGINALFGGLAIGALTKKIIDATAKQERAFKQLEQGIKSTNNAVGFSAKELANYAAELQKATTFGDEEIIQAQSQLVTFTRITGEEFNRTTEIALDMSERFGTDVKSSILQLGKALNDPIANLSALSRAGIQFSAEQKDMIKALIDSGRQVEAQRVILGELETQFGGSARAARDTFGGALEALGNSFGDLLEAKGGLNDAKDSIEEFNKFLQDPSTIEGANKLITAVISIASAMAKIPGVTIDAAEAVAKFIHGSADIDDFKEDLNDVEAEFNKVTESMRHNRDLVAKGEWVDDAVFNQFGARLVELANEAARIQNIINGLGPLNDTTKPEASSTTGTGGGGSVGGVFTKDDQKNEDDLFKDIQKEVDAVLSRVNSIVSETTPKIDQIKAKITETVALFGRGLLNEEQYAQALELYGTQLSEIALKDRTAFEEKILALEETFLTEYELLEAQKNERMELLNSEMADKILSEEETAALRLKINDKYNKDKQALDAGANQVQITNAINTASALINIASLFSNKSKTLQKALFLAEKGIAVGRAIVATNLAAAKALVIDPTGVLSAKTQFMGNLNVAAIIASAITGVGGVGGGSGGGSFGGSAEFSTPSAVSSTASQAEAQAQEVPGKSVVIEIHGDVNSNDAARLLDDLKVLINENDEVLIEQNSRNGQEIATAGGLI